jgi:hypothetical protein
MRFLVSSFSLAPQEALTCLLWLSPFLDKISNLLVLAALAASPLLKINSTNELSYAPAIGNPLSMNLEPP